MPTGGDEERPPLVESVIGKKSSAGFWCTPALVKNTAVAETKWRFPKIGVPPKHPEMIILVRKPMVVGYHHFRKHPNSIPFFFSKLG